MTNESVYHWLRPNIEIRVGQDPHVPCTAPGCKITRCIYRLEGTTDALCHGCAEKVQATLNRLSDWPNVTVIDSMTGVWEDMRKARFERLKLRRVPE